VIDWLLGFIAAACIVAFLLLAIKFTLPIILVLI